MTVPQAVIEVAIAGRARWKMVISNLELLGFDN
jgi:hypothetical protein